jgi:hypothetical protein
MGKRKPRHKRDGFQQFVKGDGKVQKQAQYILFLECGHYQVLAGLKTIKDQGVPDSLSTKGDTNISQGV